MKQHPDEEPRARTFQSLSQNSQPSDHAAIAWDLNPTSGDWNTAANWTPVTVPNGSADTATFALSNTTTVSNSANTIVDGITFAPGASSFTITASSGLTLTLNGVGISNDSGNTQNFRISAPSGATKGSGEIVFQEQREGREWDFLYDERRRGQRTEAQAGSFSMTPRARAMALLPTTALRFTERLHSEGASLYSSKSATASQRHLYQQWRRG